MTNNGDNMESTHIPIGAPKTTMAGVLHRWGPGKLWCILNEDGDVDYFARAETEERAVAMARAGGCEGELTAVEQDEDEADRLTYAQKDIRLLLNRLNILCARVGATVDDFGGTHCPRCGTVDGNGLVPECPGCGWVPPAPVAPKPVEKKAMDYARAMWPKAAWEVDDSEPDGAWVCVEENGRDACVTVTATMDPDGVERATIYVVLGYARAHRFTWPWAAGQWTCHRLAMARLRRYAAYVGTYVPSMRKARMATALLAALGEVSDANG